MNGRAYAVLIAAMLVPAVVPGQVVINELGAAPSEKRPWRDEEGKERLGSGVRWMDPGFAATNWGTGALPAGYSFSGLRLDLSSTMKGKAPSVYLRKIFQVEGSQATVTNLLYLSVRCNDGFVAYLNGRELARANCGSSNRFIFASQPAYNVGPSSTNVVEYAIGPASSWLQETGNVLAIQAHNAEQPSTVSAPEMIVSHTPTPEFYINAGLHLADDTNSPVATNIVALSDDDWRYFVGRVEPSGGVLDMGLVTKVFKPPAGEEDDYDQPADFSDWVELANYGTDVADLSNWSLSDSPEWPGKWRFPTNTLLAPGGFLVVLCDSREEANPPLGPATYLHTNFKLEAGGEYLGLFNSLGVLVDGFIQGYPAQTRDCTFGRNPHNPYVFGYLGTATPGQTNTGPFYAGRVPEPIFTDASGAPLPGGIYSTQPSRLYLGCSFPGSTVLYTTNGATPTLQTGITFTEGILLSQATEKTGIVVRARSFRAGYLPSETVTHTYLLRQNAALKNNPVLFLSGDPGQSFYAPEGLLAIVGGQFVSVNGGTVWQATGPQTYNNVLGAGPPFEREVCFEFCSPAGTHATNQVRTSVQAGLRVSASGWSRPRMKLSSVNASPWPPGDTTQKPSFNVYFSGDYGVGGLHFPVFTNYPVVEFQQLRLRAGKNDCLNPFVTDEFVRRLFLDMGQVGTVGAFWSLYVNGIYKGVFNPTERIREPFFQAHYQSEAKWDVCYIGSWVDGDGTVYQKLLTALDRNLTLQTNWDAVTALMDVDNAADYYLLNIYCAMWDWPQNNYAFARERSSGPDSRFRFVVWDAEGAFNVIGYGKSISYNTLSSDLLVASSNSLYNQSLPRIFRRLCSSQEFRLRFADRISRHMFNNGVLDDRDPDGGGPLASHFRLKLDEIVREAGGMVRYNSGSTLNTGVFNTWISPTGGRRTWLLGTNVNHTMFRSAGLWPVTEPPVFSQHGGVVAPGYGLSMTSSVAATGQTATIWFTLDGSDPRLFGGARSPAAVLYTNPVPLPSVVMVKARAQNDTMGEWSALTEASFAPRAVIASDTNLVVAELMYHPPAPTAAEYATGFGNAEDFEFVRLLNIGSEPINLASVRLTQGIAFDFSASSLAFLNPGANALLVRSRSAFEARYGSQFESSIAGEYSGNLSNGGERLQLLGANNLIIRDFTYSDNLPWPVVADGGGSSLLLTDPFSNPDHGNAANWAASAIPGGLPGGVAPVQSYATWRALFWNSIEAADDSKAGPAADPDNDGLSNLAEYAFGTNPHVGSVAPSLSCWLTEVDEETRLGVSVRLAGGAKDARIVWESSEDLETWSSEGTSFELVETTLQFDGTSICRYLEATPFPQLRFIRMRVEWAGN